MTKLIIARYGEIHLKGNNRGLFLDRLLRNMKKRLGDKISVKHSDTRIEISGYNERDEQEILGCVRNTFGVSGANVATVISTSKENIFDYLKSQKIETSFKIEVNRADKTFPHKSPEFASMCGGVILDNNKSATVNLQSPEAVINIDIRGNGRTYIFTENTTQSTNGVGGLPVGVSGRAIVLLSGGIDSPVATYLAAKRGLSVDFIHFATPPYTSDLSIKKIEKLQSTLENYVGKTRLFIVPFTEISREIQKKCHEEFMITIMRRFMVRIAEQVGIKVGAHCIITGENLAQVASQTIQGIASNNFCAEQLPILRPLITYDKAEIIQLAKKIDTYKISIEPHIDCCTVFVPKRPSIKPRLSDVFCEEEKLDIEKLIENALSEIVGQIVGNK